MKIKTTLIALLCILWLATPAFAQEQEPPKAEQERFRLEKMAYLIREVALTTEESGAFFPIYNEMQEKIYNLHRTCRQKTRGLKGKESVKEQEYLDAVDELINLECRQAELEAKYYKQFRKILPAEKLYRLKVAEKMYPIHLFKRRNGNNPPPPLPR